jgi:GTPase SAR1 family protein
MSKEVISVTNGNIFLNFWDTSGMEINNKVLSSQIYRSADCFVILCSYDNIASLNNLNNWIDYLKRFTDRNGIPTPIFIVFNKFDKKKQFSGFEIKNKLNELMASYEAESLFVCEGVSVKEEMNLTFLFENIISQLIGDRLKNDSSFYNYSEKYRREVGKSFKLERNHFNCKNVSCC